MKSIWTKEEEAARLSERFEAIPNRAEFGRQIGVSQALIYQHINGVRRISLAAAQRYAKGFGCSVADISPRLAEEARATLSLSAIALLLTFRKALL